MPHYEYLCESGHETEVEQRITDEPLTECGFNTLINKEELEGIEGYGKKGKFMKCGEPCRRQLCKSSFALKGGGWSGDGYAKKGN